MGFLEDETRSVFRTQSNMEFLGEIIKEFQPLSIFAESFLDAGLAKNKKFDGWLPAPLFASRCRVLDFFSF